MVTRCERCGSVHSVAIDLELGDGTRIEFRSCHMCESKTWVAANGPISLERVLELTAANKPR